MAGGLTLGAWVLIAAAIGLGPAIALWFFVVHDHDEPAPPLDSDEETHSSP